MSGAPLPEPVAEFIDHYVQSVSDLETLLWLRPRADRPIGVDDLRTGLGMAPWQGELVLRRLAGLGLVESVGDRWRYAGEAGGPDEPLAWLAEYFGRYRVTVTARIFAKPSHAEGEDR
jgi:hypothetical protein